MPPDPFEVLGIAADATLGEARAAYRRVVALFHPDHLQGMRAEVRAEGEKRLREATEALEAIRSGYGSLRRRGLPRWPGAGGPEAVDGETGHNYNAQIRDEAPDGIHADWSGPHAAALYTALRRAHTVEGPVQQVEWGAFECTMPGSEVKRLIATVFTDGSGWRAEPLETLDVGSNRLVGTLAPEPPGSRDLGWLADHVADRRRYVVTAEVFG